MKNLNKLRKKVMLYQTLIVVFGIIGMWGMIITGQFWLWIFLSLVFEGLLVFKIKKLSKEYNIEIDWKHYWLGWGREKIKEK